jgi:hypothetical protein
VLEAGARELMRRRNDAAYDTAEYRFCERCLAYVRGSGEGAYWLMEELDPSFTYRIEATSLPGGAPPEGRLLRSAARRGTGRA